MQPLSLIRRIPWSIVVCACALVGMGLLGIARGDELAGSGSFLLRQLAWVCVAIPALIIAACINYRRLRLWSYPLFWLTLGLLVAVFFMPARNGARRWFPLGPASFQPSELMKLVYILALSHYLMYRANYRSLVGLVVPFLLTLVPVVLILKEPNLGTSLLFFPVLYATLFAAGAKWKQLVAIAALGLLCTPLLWTFMSAEQRSRVTAVFTQEDGGETPRGDAYHLHQSKQVLALGGVWGSDIQGMPLSDGMAYHLPEARTDFIYCLVGERRGWVGCVAVLIIYLVLVGSGLRIAAATQEPFGRLLAVGVVTLIATQVIINTGMTIGLMPITGITLPLLSHGGSSLVTTCAAIGLLINVGLHPEYSVRGEPFRWT